MYKHDLSLDMQCR